MERARKNVRIFSVVAMFWSLGNIILYSLINEMALYVEDAQQAALLADSNQQDVAYLLVMIAAVFGMYATNKTDLWIVSFAVCVLALLMNIILPLMTETSISFITIAFPLLISYWIVKMHQREVQKAKKEQNTKTKKR